MAKDDKKSPAWGYTAKDGVLVSQLFDDGNLPKGWQDSPAKVKLDADRK